MVVETCTGIPAIQTGSLSVYPHPTTGPVKIQMEGPQSLDRFLVDVYDATGVRLQHKMVNGSTAITILLDGYPAGCYLIRITSGADAWMVKLMKF